MDALQCKSMYMRLAVSVSVCAVYRHAALRGSQGQQMLCVVQIPLRFVRDAVECWPLWLMTATRYKLSSNTY